MSRDIRIPESLIAGISDPFEVLPLVQALRGLGQLIEENNHQLFSLYEDGAPRYRDIGLEQGLEAVSIIMGAGFVAAQRRLQGVLSLDLLNRLAAGGHQRQGE